MKRCMACVGVLLVLGLLVSCGGGGSDGSSGSGTSVVPSAGTPGTPNGGNPATPSGGNPAAGDPPAVVNPPAAGTPPIVSTTPPPPVTARFEESDATKVTMSAGWTPSDGIAGWSGGAAVQSIVAGATV